MPSLVCVVGRPMSRWFVATALGATVVAGCSDEPQSPSRSSPADSPAASDRIGDSDADPEVAGKGKDRPGADRPDTAKEALAALMHAEAAIADPLTRPKELVRAARVQQLVYRELGARRAWDAKV